MKIPFRPRRPCKCSEPLTPPYAVEALQFMIDYRFPLQTAASMLLQLSALVLFAHSVGGLPLWLSLTAFPLFPSPS